MIAAGRRDRWPLPANRAVPEGWFGKFAERDVVCLASGGDQQAPVLAAAGACVTQFDLSGVSWSRPRAWARRCAACGCDMADLAAFDDAGFDLVFHPVSDVCVPDVRWSGGSAPTCWVRAGVCSPAS